MGFTDHALWSQLHRECCVEPAYARDFGAVVVPDAFASLLETCEGGTSGLDDLSSVRLVRSGIVSRPGGGPWVLPVNASVLVNIGAHGYLEAEWIYALRKPATVLICFEPDRANFHRLRLWVTTTLVSVLGEEVVQRVFVLPCAVGPVATPVDRFAWLHRSSFAEGQCNSLLPPRAERKSALSDAGCGADTMLRERVLVVTLREVLERLAGARVELVKVDAQGLDLQIIESGVDLVSQRVGRLQIEVQDVPDGDEVLIYVGMHTKQAALATLAKLGFELITCTALSDEREQDCTFRNRRQQGRVRRSTQWS